MARKGLSLGIVVTALVLGLPATGQTVVDGDTIDLKGTIFGLHGIDAPDLRQVCADGWPVGRAARDYLSALIGTKEVSCTTRMGEFDHITRRTPRRRPDGACTVTSASHPGTGGAVMSDVDGYPPRF